LIVEQMYCRWLEKIAGYVENKRETRYQQENERGQEVTFSVLRSTITF